MIAFLLAAAVTLIPGSASIWTDGQYTWAGPQDCRSAGFLLAPDNPINDQGLFIPEIHCPTAGPNLGGCQEWLGIAPPIGACDTAPSTTPNPPSDLVITRATQKSE